jgi:hypothetical protein
LEFIYDDLKLWRPGDSENETTTIFDMQAQSWKPFLADIGGSQSRMIFGITVPIVSKKDLIERKKRLGREVDLEDVKQLSLLA